MSPPEAVERALRRRAGRPAPGTGVGEPDRRAAVVLVLRRGTEPGDERSPGPRDGGEAGARESVADPARGRRRDEAPAPLFPRPLVPDLRGVEALFIVRAEQDGDPWSGQVALPGGHAEAVDSDLLAAALRELREEAGLQVPRSAVLGRLEEIRPRSRRLPSVGVTPFVAWHAGRGRVEPGPEVAGHFWMRLDALESPRHRTVLTFRRRGAFRVFPGVGHEQGVVWGLTFAILRRFLGRLPRDTSGGAG